MRLLVVSVTIGALALCGSPDSVSADTREGRVQAAGYFRVMARPDLQGGDSRLGFWNLYGRLLNEGPWAALGNIVGVLAIADGVGQAVGLGFAIAGLSAQRPALVHVGASTRGLSLSGRF